MYGKKNFEFVVRNYPPKVFAMSLDKMNVLYVDNPS
jgi:hypothetical protein